MDDLAFLHDRIESYADYTNDESRVLADEQIRAYAGEALARLAERLAPADAAAETLSRVILRCQFADQTLVRALTDLRADAPESAAIHAVDRRLVELADKADAIAYGDVGVYLTDVETALDARKQRIIEVTAADEARPRTGTSY